jgi:hypothetical protein
MEVGQEPILTTAKSGFSFFFFINLMFIVLTSLTAASMRISLVIIVALIYVKLFRNIFNLLKLLKNVDFNLSQ